jgi:hypothetical protein
VIAAVNAAHGEIKTVSVGHKSGRNTGLDPTELETADEKKQKL